MKHLRKYNEKRDSNEDFESVYEILREIEVEGYKVVVFSSNGFAFYLNDINNDHSNYFNFESDNRFWNFRVDNNMKEYQEFITFVKFMEHILNRIEELGWKIETFKPYAYKESNNLFDAVEFKFKPL